MLICLNDLFACLGLAQTRKLLTNFSKNSFYLLPEPLRLGEFLTNYCKIIKEIKLYSYHNVVKKLMVFLFERKSLIIEYYKDNIIL